jgi:hypothetical protein
MLEIRLHWRHRRKAAAARLGYVESRLCDRGLTNAIGNADSFDSANISANISLMGRTHRTQVALYLDADRIELLNQLKEKTGLDGQTLLRRALDSLLIRHKLLKAPKPRAP